MNLVQDAQAIFEGALRGVRPDALMQRPDLSDLLSGVTGRFERVVVVGAGKAALVMAGALEACLPDRIDAGLVVIPHGYAASLPAGVPTPQRITVIEAGHPVPDQAGFDAAARVLRLVAGCTPRDLVIALLSGGGSALWPAVVGAVPFADAQQTYTQLLHSGAEIHAVNTVRKHLSRLGGGRLAAATPATVYALVLSDVVGNDLSTIASGPCSPDPTTFADAQAVLARYQLWQTVPASVRRYIEQGMQGVVPETPKPGAAVFNRVEARVLGSNQDALAAGLAAATNLGYTAQVVQTNLTGEARAVGRALVDHALAQPAAPHPRCLLWGGETTVTVRGRGKGGRNQEVALGAAMACAGRPERMLLLSGGTDGIDGPTDAAGAWATPATLARAEVLGLDANTALANNDAYPYFDALGQLLKPGPTHTNVMDLQVVLLT